MSDLYDAADAIERDHHRGGSNYEASMLRNLLARIHRDGGHYVEEHGLDKALEDAEAKIVEWLALQDKVGDLYDAADAIERVALNDLLCGN